MTTLHLPFPSIIIIQTPTSSRPFSHFPNINLRSGPVRLNRRSWVRFGPVCSFGKDETELQVSTEEEQKQDEEEEEEEEEEEDEEEPSPQDLEFVEQIKRVLELLRKNRDMTFGEVKLTIMIEDPRDIERKILLGIEDLDEVSRDDLADALEDVYEGRIPKDRLALQLLAEEMIQWPDLEVEAKKSKPRKSLYAKATDTGVDPREAVKRLDIDWDSAADIEEDDDDDEMEVPAAVGYSALYFVTGLPILIGVSVVLILFYNSLQ